MTRKSSLAIFIFTLHLVAAQPVQYMLVGQTGSLTPEMKTISDGSQILWKHNGDKVVEFNGKEEHVYNSYKDRVTLNWHTAELEISGLTYEDSGEYELEVYNKKLDLWNIIVKVIDKVSKPTISCEIVKEGINSDESGNRATLMCSAESRQSESLMKLEWSSLGNTLPGPNITISLGDQHNNEEYNCTVSNPLSRETTTFTAKDCHPETNSTALIVGVCALLVILLAVGLLVFWKLRQKCAPEEKRGSPEEEAFIVSPSTCQSPGTPGTDDAKSGQIITEMRGSPEEEAFGRQPTFRSPQRLAGLAPETKDMESNQINTVEEKKGSPGKGVSMGWQSTPQSPRSPPGSPTNTDDTESDEKRSVKDRLRHFEMLSDPQVICPRKPRRSNLSGEFGFREKESKGDDNKTNPTPAHPNNVCTSPSVPPSSPSALNSSNAPHEGDIDEHQEEANLGQVSEEEVTVGESGLEEGKESGSNSKHPELLSPEHKEIAAQEQNAEPADSDTSSINEAKGPDDQENPAQQFDIPKGSKHEDSFPHELSQSPETAADDQKRCPEKDNTTCDSQSDDIYTEESEENKKPATQQEDQVTEKAKPGLADAKAKDPEEVLPPDEAKKALTPKQTSEEVKKESQPAEASQQEEEESDEDQQENNEQPESVKSSKQEKHDTISSDSTTAAAASQGDNSRHSSQSESSSEEAERGEREIKSEQSGGDASENEDKANADQVSGTSDSATDQVG